MHAVVVVAVVEHHVSQPAVGDSMTVVCPGNNMLFVGMMGPEVPVEELVVKHMGSCKYTVNYIVKMTGRYILVVRWGDQDIPGSPYTVDVA